MSPAHYPEFSWDTLPLYMHIRKSRKFSENEIKYLASFPLITLEKTTGHKSFGTTDAGTVAAAKAIKEVNPAAKVLFYRNIIVHYGGYSFDAELKEIESPFLIGKEDKPVLVRDRIASYDIANPEVQDWWVNSAATVCRNEAVDGLFIDGNVKVLSAFLRMKLSPDQRSVFLKAYDETMARIRKELGADKLILANVMRSRLANSGLDNMQFFDGSYLEGFDVSTGNSSGVHFMLKGIEAAQTAGRQGKIIAMTLGIGASAATGLKIDDVREKVTDLKNYQDRINYCIALFLICAEKYSYLYLHDGYSAEVMRGECQSKVWLKRLPEYDKPLGPPKGSAMRNGTTFTREFQHASVFLDLENKVGKVTWHGEPLD